MLITALGADYSIEKIQGSVEMRGILLEKSIKEAGCHIEETVDGKYCFISDANADAVSWDRVVPL